MYGASIGLGYGFVLFAVPQLPDVFGWRGAFLACALLAAAVWAWWMWTAPLPQPKTPGGATTPDGPSSLPGLRRAVSIEPGVS
jgi:predicted MFS family arabinose efflux permease